MEKLSVFKKTVEMKEMICSHYNREKFIEFCKDCKNYGNRWSCPPFDFSEKELLSKYQYVTLVMTKVELDEEAIESVLGNDAIFEYTEKVINNAKKETEPRILKMELNSLGSLALASGGCRLCKNCTRSEGKPCRKPKQSRYSLESLGFDVIGIAKDYFDTEMLWVRGKLPKYFLLVNALFTNEIL